MKRYVDGYLLPLPKSNIAAYKEVASLCAEVWLEYGALEYSENIAEDVPHGELTSFPLALHLQEDEVAVFSWIVFESRVQRDEINDKVMKDPRIAVLDSANVPFDGKRLMWGGFEPLVFKQA